MANNEDIDFGYESEALNDKADRDFNNLEDGASVPFHIAQMDEEIDNRIAADNRLQEQIDAIVSKQELADIVGTYANGINTNTYNAFTADGYPRDYVNLYNTSSTQTPLYYCYRASLGGIYLYYYTQNEYTTIPDGVTVYWKDTGSNQATSSSELNGNFVASGLTAPTRYSSGDLYT